MAFGPIVRDFSAGRQPISPLKLGPMLGKSMASHLPCTIRGRGTYAWRRFLDSQVTLAFGTDYPMERITPVRGLYAAMTRPDETRNHAFPGNFALDRPCRLYERTGLCRIRRDKEGKAVARQRS